jgi:predicted CoA-binding protein
MTDIEAFLATEPIAVIGASADPGKFGYRVLAAYLSHGIDAIPINPSGGRILGQTVYARLSDVNQQLSAASIITPPDVTAKVIDEAIDSGLKRLWLQPGAENLEAIERAEAAGLKVIWGGPCVLVELARRRG